MIDEKPNTLASHEGNDILSQAKYEDIARSITNIRLDCKNNGANEVVISFVLVKKNPNVTIIVCRVNDLFRDPCEKMF